ncbi:MAG: nickel/cobalt transporter (NicO) family protein, partial [Mycobacteriales bacterium]
TIGLTVTATHTAGVLVLGAVLTTSVALAPQTLYPWLGVASGLILAAVGVTLVRRVRGGADLTHSHQHRHSAGHQHPHTHVHGSAAPHHAHEPAAPDHVHEPAAPDHVHAAAVGRPVAVLAAAGHSAGHVHAAIPASDRHGQGEVTPVQHDHGHPEAPAGARMIVGRSEAGGGGPAAAPHDHDGEGGAPGHVHSHGPAVRRRGLLAMGFAGGLVPSPSALVVLLGAIALGRTWFGILLVIGYGAGMAATLMGVGLLLARCRRLLERRPLSPRIRSVVTRLPLATAALVVVVGIGLAAQAVLTLTTR